MSIFPKNFHDKDHVVEWLAENIGGPVDEMYYGFAGPGWRVVRFVTSSINILNHVYIDDKEQYLKALLYFGDDDFIQVECGPLR